MHLEPKGKHREESDNEKERRGRMERTETTRDIKIGVALQNLLLET